MWAKILSNIEENIDIIEIILFYNLVFETYVVGIKFETKENKMATKIKIDGKWYRGGEKADGSIEFKNDLDYHGSTTQVEYTAKKPNPVLQPGLYHVYSMSGGKEGEFWTDPQISYSGCITDIETDIKNSSGNSNSNYNSDSVSNDSGRPSGTNFEDFSGWDWFWFILLIALRPYIELFYFGFWVKFTAMRKDWWRNLGCTLVFTIISAIIVFGIAHAESISASVIWMILTFLPIVVISFSRIRDTGKPWWWTLIPGANIVMCGFFPSDYSITAEQNTVNPVNPVNPNDKSSIGFAILSFFIPLVGLILFLVWKKDTPLKAKSCGIGALIGFVLSVVVQTLLFIHMRGFRWSL
jgi:uncharacterized membrane protein YhaH (DUF805 family)